MENTDITQRPFQILGSLSFSSDEHMEVFMDTLDKNSALYCLVEGVKYGNSRGLFTLGEAELLAKCIRVISKEQQNKENGTPNATQ